MAPGGPSWEAMNFDDTDLVRLARTPLPVAPESPWPEEPREPREPYQSPKAGLPGALSTKLTGCSFAPGYPTVLLLLDVVLEGNQPEIILQREKHNVHDRNAISVVWVAERFKDMVSTQHHLGYIPAPLAARIAPEIDERWGCWKVTSTTVLVTPQYPDRPGVSIRLVRDPG